MDAEAAVRLGADYAGVIFAGGPRALDARRAREVMAPTEGSAITRVGVFGDQAPDEIATIAAGLELGVVQLHGVRSPEVIAGIARETGRETWAVVRIAGAAVPEGLDTLFACARGIVLDGGLPGTLGGTGTTFDWPAVRERVDRSRAGRRVILAGGLTPENVDEGIRVLRPDVVDVSSGVETAVGVKDPARMAAFVQAARSVS
jgi:phosphoribosylanthranilate isomerase